MKNFNNIDREFALGDIQFMKVFNESNFVNISRQQLYGKQMETAKIRFDYYSNMLQKAIDDFETIKINKDAVANFSKKYHQLQSLGRPIELQINAITDNTYCTFKPQYIPQYLSIIQNLIQKAVDNKLTDRELENIVIGDTVEVVEKQVVRNAQSYGLKPSAIGKDYIQDIVKVDAKYAKNVIVPFLTSAEQRHKTILNESEATLKVIDVTLDKLQETFNNIAEIKENIETLTKDQNDKINQLVYNGYKGVIEIIAFTVAMLLNNMQKFSSKVSSCNKLYTDVCNLYYTTFTTKESAFDSSVLPTDTQSLSEYMIKGSADPYRILAENIYDFHASIPRADLVSSELGDGDIDSEVERNQNDYDKTPYETITKVFLEISAGLDVMSLEGGDYLFVASDIIKKAGFAMSLEDRFQNEIRMITDVSNYKNTVDITYDKTNNSEIFLRVLAEVKDYGNNLDGVAKACKTAYDKMLLLANRYSDNVNGEYKDAETINELQITLTSLKEQFEKIVDHITLNFFDRLKSLGNILELIEDKTNATVQDTTVDTTPIETDSRLSMNESVMDASDYLRIAMESNIDMEIEEGIRRIKYLQEQYNIERAALLRGERLIYEDDNDNASDNGGSNSQQQANDKNANQNQNNANNNSDNDGKNNQSTKPTVVDNNTNNTNNNGNDNNGNGSSSIPGFIKKIQDFFNKLIEKFSNTVKRHKGDSDFISSNREYLMSRSYSNVTVNVLPYKEGGTEEMISAITTMEQVIRAMHTGNNKMNDIKSQQDIANKLFSSHGNFKINDDDKGLSQFSEDVTKYYKTGDKPDDKTEAFSNDNLDNLVKNTMVPFVEDYYNPNGFSKKLSDAKDSLNRELDNFSKDMINAQNPTDKNETTPDTKVKWLSSIVNIFIGAVMNAYRDRANDYMKIIKELSKNNPGNKNNNNQENNNNNENDNQNNGNQNNNS